MSEDAIQKLEKLMRKGFILRMQEYEKGKFILYGTHLNKEIHDISCTGISLAECIQNLDEEDKEVKP